MEPIIEINYRYVDDEENIRNGTLFLSLYVYELAREWERKKRRLVGAGILF